MFKNKNNKVGITLANTSLSLLITVKTSSCDVGEPQNEIYFKNVIYGRSCSSVDFYIC